MPSIAWDRFEPEETSPFGIGRFSIWNIVQSRGTVGQCVFVWIHCSMDCVGSVLRPLPERDLCGKEKRTCVKNSLLGDW